MLVNVNMSREVHDYFKDYDLDSVADRLLEMYDFTNLPATTGKRYSERKVNVSNEAFISLYKSLGPRNKKVSLARLFEFAYNMDVLALERFKEMKIGGVHDPVPACLERAYAALLSAQKYDKSTRLATITEALYAYKKYKEAEAKERIAYEMADLCPLGGDINDDCADCCYAGEYHYVDGECVRRCGGKGMKE